MFGWDSQYKKYLDFSYGIMSNFKRWTCLKWKNNYLIQMMKNQNKII